MIKLVVKKNDIFLNNYEFNQPIIQIGRGTDCDIVLQRPTVSRIHATIEHHKDFYRLVDDSSYGTKVNKQSITSHQLKQDDVILIFPYSIEVSHVETSQSSLRFIDPVKDDMFDPDMDDEGVDKILNIEPFASIDQKNFPKNNPLKNIIKQHTKLRRYIKNDIIIREGDYGNTVFHIISGSVNILTENLPMTMLGHTENHKKNPFSALSQLWKNSQLPEVRDLKLYQVDARLGQRVTAENEARFFLQDISSVIDPKGSIQLMAGEFFGEISALGRTPRSTTVLANSEVEILEIRWQGLRDIRKYDGAMRQHIDSIYRDRSLKIHLHTSPFFHQLQDDQLEQIVNHTVFESFGNFNWQTSFNQYAKLGSSYTLQSEPVIVKEGDYPNGLIMIRSGFVRVSKQVNHGHHTYSYLGRGSIFGMEELAYNWRNKENAPYRQSLRAIGYADILIVPTCYIEDYILSRLSEEELTHILSKYTHSFLSENNSLSDDQQIDQGMMEFLVEERFINGTSTMFIDMDRCTRCDDCVQACAAAHDNNPRFIRHGKKYDNIMVANACMHCSDPVCMIGCPTGAIHRNENEGQIIINDVTCIGCGTCANSCPYNNIRMVKTRDQNGEIVTNPQTLEPVNKATKCDLCVDQLGGPACERACPHDALKRIDLRDQSSLLNWLTR